ncbi:hypothetical protein [Rhizobium sp. MHM7A]|uniref:hypothetical protein n=1 Tax=Rhizobium sp. MHM7A TaxID=2583233 RepID=UPI001106234D|nr:hypothetical protein [Rhizobium sp. MHM7A]TLX15923.1 hypothetical protein FFR93_00995 [Rhizobium sp. MHM7A]
MEPPCPFPALQPDGKLAVFNGPTGYFLAFGLTEEDARLVGVAHGMTADDADNAVKDGLHDKVYADIDQPFGTRRWNELICSIEKDRGETIAKLALDTSGHTDYVVPDKIRARFNLPTETQPALGRTTPNNVMPLYFLKCDDTTGMVHFRDDMAERCSFKITADGGFELWRLEEDMTPSSKFDIEGMEFEILLPLRGDTKIRREFERWYQETYPNAVNPAPGLR